MRPQPKTCEKSGLKPDFWDAHAARGSLYYQQGKPEAGIADLEFAAARQPDNATNLDRLGQAYAALDRPADALRVLRRAADLAPGDPRIHLHLGRALADAGEAAQSKAVLNRFRLLSSKRNTVPAGLVAYLSLTPEQQRADYRSRVETAVRENPSDAGAQLRHLQLLLEDRKLDLAPAAARRLAGLKPGPAALADAGRSLLEAKQYALAKELLAAAGASAGVELDLAIATYHTVGAAEGLRRIERVPQPARNGDYYLARAQMLSASGKFEDAVLALDGPDVPQSREIQVMKAATLEVAGRSLDAGRLLAEIQNLWPEWRAGWVARGIMLATHRQFAEARQALEAAVALGARSHEVYFHLADSNLHTAPPRIGAAEAAIRQAQKLAPDDAWIQALAGRIVAQKAGRRAEPQPVPGAEPTYLRRLIETKLPREW